MTYNVFGGTLNLALSMYLSIYLTCVKRMELQRLIIQPMYN